MCQRSIRFLDFNTTSAVIFNLSLPRCRNENKMLKNQSVRHRKHMKSNHGATKAKEQEWITFTKYLKTFHNGCTCQPKNKSMIQPTEYDSY